MDYDYENGGSIRNLFRSFVCVTLTILVLLQFYLYVWGPPHDSEGDFSDIKYVIMQLTRGLSEVNHKHEKLRGEMERMSAVMPGIVAAAGRAKDALEPSLYSNSRQAIDVLDYDRQMADYALEYAGGRVVDTGDTVEHIINESPVSWMLHGLTYWMCRECQGARVMIRPGTLPGECWAFKGSRGEATIRLVGTVRISGFSIEHIPTRISPTREITSAPRLFHIEGLEFRTDPYPHDFGTFEYDKEGKPIQYFEVLHYPTKGYNFIRIRILSNWGHPVYTCVYRIRVHGELVSSKKENVGADDAVLIENE